jgi:DeoR family transcriptional regulator of aga operon
MRPTKIVVSRARPQGTEPSVVLLDGLNASIAFIGCNGVDVAGGVTNVNLPEAEVKRAMLLSTRRPVVVADGSKLGEVEVAKICELSEVSLVVTDASADPSILADLSAVECDVQVAEDAR